MSPVSDKRDYYDVLGIPKNAPPEEINKAYRRIALEWVQRFKDREQRMPRTWQELVTAERLPGIPVDPAGVPLVVDTVTGRVDVSKQSPLWPLPAEPKVEQR